MFIFQHFLILTYKEYDIIMKLSKLLNEFISDCEYKNLSQNTINNYTRVINDLIHYVDDIEIEEINNYIIKDYINNLELATSSKNQYLRCISSFINYYKYEYEKDLHIKIRRLKEPREIKYTPTHEEVKKLKDFYNNKTYLMSRNKTIIYTFINLGLRGSELLNLKRCDVDLNNNLITIRKRKGNIDQQLPLNKEIKNQLTKYINRYEIENEYLFVTRNNNPMNMSDLHYLLHKCNNKINPHSLRRFCCTRMLLDGVPMVMVSRFMNHNSIELTNSYYANIKATDIIF